MPVIRAPYPAVTALTTLKATNFSEYTVGQAPTGWTPRWVTTNGGWFIRADANSLSGKILRPEFTVNARRAITWNVLNGKTDFHMLALVRMDTQQSADGAIEYTRLIGRLLGTDVSSTMQAYFVTLRSDNSNLLEYTDGVGTASGAQAATPAFSAGTLRRCWIRMSAVGGQLLLKTWAFGSSENTVGTSGSTDATPRAAGDIGVGGFTSSTNGAFEYLAVDDTPPPVPV